MEKPGGRVGVRKKLKMFEMPIWHSRRDINYTEQSGFQCSGVS